MRIICRDRRRGKTSDLIAIAHENDYYMVCQDRRAVSNTVQMANDMGMSIRFPITFYEFINKEYYGKNIKGFVIDDADVLIQHLTSIRVCAAAVQQDTEDAE